MTTELIPIEQRDVEWQGEILVAVLVDEGQGQEIYVPIQPINDYLALSGRYGTCRYFSSPALTSTRWEPVRSSSG